MSGYSAPTDGVLFTVIWRKAEGAESMQPYEVVVTAGNPENQIELGVLRTDGLRDSYDKLRQESLFIAETIDTYYAETASWL